MTPDHRTKLVISRTSDYVGIMRTTLFGLIAVAAIVHFGPNLFSGPLAMLAITLSAYGILAGGSALDDLINLREDLDAEMSATTYGAGVIARDLPKLKIVSAALIGLTGLVELFAIVA
jgi:hypothetical protein